MLRKNSVLSFLACSHSINHFTLTEKATAGQLCLTQVRRLCCKEPEKEKKDCPIPPRDDICENDIYRINRPKLVVKSMPICNVKPALDCKAPKLDQPCTEHMPVTQFVPPPPTKPRFPWVYLLPIIFLFGSCGIVYQLYEKKVKRGMVTNVKMHWKPRKVKKIPRTPEDLPKEVQYLIIGAGAAGMAAYNAIKEHDQKAKVLLVSDEDIKPYIRTGLSKELWTMPHSPDIEKLSYIDGRQEISMFYTNDDEYVDALEFAELEEGPAASVASGWTVARVDADMHTAYISTDLDDFPIKYDKCLIATGSEPRDLNIFKVAPHEVKEKVCRLRRIRDLEVAWHMVRSASKILIIGDGPLACELAYTLKHLDEYVQRDTDEGDIEVTQIVKRPGVLSKVIPDYLGQWAAENIKTDGVKLITNLEMYDCYLTKENEMKVFLSNGEEITCDFIFLAIGATPRTDLAERSSLEQDKELGGYIVNTELLARTDLYVAGDCASIYDLQCGSRVRLEHYGSAVDMGCLAGENMTGHMKPFTKPGTFTVKLGKDIVMQAFGQTKSSMATVGVFTTCTIEQNKPDPQNTFAGDVRAQGEVPCYKKTEEYKKRFKKGVIFYLKDTENIAGIVLWNMGGKEQQVLEILENNPTYDEIKSFVTKLELHEEDCCKQSA